MISFARVALVIFYIIEIFCALCAFTGLVFKSKNLEGADILLILSFFLFAFIYFLAAIIPYYKKLVSDNPVFQQVPILILHRLLYFTIGCLALVELFYILDLDGKETLGLIVLVPLLIFALIAIILMFLRSERRLVFQWVFFRMVIFLILYFIKALSFF